MLAESGRRAGWCARTKRLDLGKGPTRGTYGLGKKERRPGRSGILPGRRFDHGASCGSYGKVSFQPLM